METSLSLLSRTWQLEDGSKLETKAIFSKMLAGALDPGELCWDESEPERRSVGARFPLIGRYGILRELGTGGFGKVFLAVDARDGDERLVALKQPTERSLEVYAEKAGFRAPLDLSPTEVKARARDWARPEVGQVFSEEALMTARLAACPYVVSIIEADIRAPFLALEYCDGGSLADRKLQSYTAGDVARWGSEIAAALEAAHGLRPDPLIHRDLKPDNVLLHQGRVKVSDFGISKMVRETRSMLTGGGAGTPVYMAPETFEGRVHRGTDLWALGVILYELLAGRQPFTGDNIVLLARRISEAAPAPLTAAGALQAPADMRAFVSRCFARDPAERPEAAEARRALARWAVVASSGPRAAVSASPGSEAPTISAADPPRPVLKARVKPSLSLDDARAALDDRAAWSAASEALQDLAIEAVGRDLGEAYHPVEPRVYRCGDQQHRVGAFCHADSGVVLNLIPGGSFALGSEAHEREGPMRELRIRPFLMGRTAVSQGEWTVAGGRNLSYFRDRKNAMDRPVEQVTWDEAGAWIARLGDPQLRLPSEAEWEYAARAGSSSDHCFGEHISSEQANFDGRHPRLGGPLGVFRGETVPVGSLPPNAFGLFEVHGNVWEWCQDGWAPHYLTGPEDEQARPDAEDGRRVLRGGSWFGSADCARSAYRYGEAPSLRSSSVGLRLARSIEL